MQWQSVERWWGGRDNGMQSGLVDGEEREHSWILEATKHAPQVRSIRRLAACWRQGGAQSLRAQAGGGEGVHAAA